MNLSEIPATWPEEEHFLYSIPDSYEAADVEEYGKRIKLRRLKLGYSLQTLGDAVGRSYEAVRKIEEGKPKSINRDLVPLFAKKLDCSCSYLLGNAPDVNGIWIDPDTALKMPVRPCRADEIAATSAMIAGYNRDPQLFTQCLRALKEPSREIRKLYAKALRNAIKRFHSR